MYCPTKDDTLAALLALLPRGRAWQSHEGGPEPYHDAAFDPRVFDPDVFDTETRTGSILYRFWEAVAYVVTFANDRLCALALEMFCATQSETREQWLTEYGLPDPCDPFPDLCDKVAALGGARCEYFNERIARLGWRAVCFEKSNACGALAGCARPGNRKTVAGGSRALALVVRIHTGEADLLPALQKRARPPYAGRFRAGQRPSCDTVSHPSVTAVRCLMDRIAPAHVTLQYVF